MIWWKFLTFVIHLVICVLKIEADIWIYVADAFQFDHKN